ncbi:MAG TPA: hypothetical protein VHO29_11340 [Marmoricola sp.]|nr:hypothetical protein [Marmoricola sp.]
MTLLLAIAAGALSLGALGGGGGSILAVPVLVYLLGQDAAQATTGSLVVVGVTSLTGAITAQRAGNVMLGRGVTLRTRRDRRRGRRREGVSARGRLRPARCVRRPDAARRRTEPAEDLPAD